MIFAPKQISLQRLYRCVLFLLLSQVLFVCTSTAQTNNWRTLLDTVAILEPNNATSFRLTEVPAARPRYTKAMKSYLSGYDYEYGYVLRFEQDSTGNIWFLRYGKGLTKFDGKTFTDFGVEEGLSDPFVHQLTIDTSGDLWITTNSMQVYRYDGVKFEKIDRTKGFHSEGAYYAKADRFGNVWFSMKDSLFRFNGEKFEPMHHSWWDGTVTYPVAVGDDGRVWLFSESKGFSKLVNDTLVMVSVPNIGKVDFATADQEGNLFWLDEDYPRTLFQFDGSSIKALDFHTDREPFNFLYLQCDNKGRVWIGIYPLNPIYYADGTFHTLNNTKAFQNSQIGACFVDEENTVWFGSSVGIAQFTKPEINLYNDDENIVNNKVILDDSETYYMTTKGLLHAVDGQYYKVLADGDLNELFASKLFLAEGGRKLACFYDGFGYIEGDELRYHRDISPWIEAIPTHVHLDKSGRLWVGGKYLLLLENDILYRFNLPEKDFIRGIAEDENGNIFIAGADGIENFGPNGSYIHHSIDAIESKNLAGIRFDPYGNLLILGPSGSYALNSKNDSITALFSEITKEKDLLDMVYDQQGRVWCTIDGKLLCFEAENPLNYREFGLNEGIDIGRLLYLRIAENEPNVLRILGSHGMAELNLAADSASTNLLHVVINKLSINRDKVNWKDQQAMEKANFQFDGLSPFTHLPTSLELNYLQNRLLFEFNAVVFNRNDEISYQFILEGNDGKWSSWESESRAEYSNLPPGNYVFKVRSKNPSGAVSETAQFAFIIHPPYWATWWFRSLAVLLILAVAFGAYRYRVRQIKERNRQLTLEVDRQTVEILQQKETLEDKNNELSNTINELNATRDQLVESEKMAVLGQLVAAVAHELNTPLGAMKASMVVVSDILEYVFKELLEVFSKLDDKELKCLVKLIDAGTHEQQFYSTREERRHKRALRSTLEEFEVEDVEELLNLLVESQMFIDLTPFKELFVHPQRLKIMRTVRHLALLRKSSGTVSLAIEKSTKVVFALTSYARYEDQGHEIDVDLKQNLETILTIYNNQLKQGINVISDLNPVVVKAYPDELSQIWTNLIHNAIQAMDGKGTLKISIDEVGDHVDVSVEDSGSGIPDDIKDRIFDPFFTTKSLGEGSGLGLNIVQKIVHRHQGKISVESRPGKTVFVVRLPKTLDESMK